MLRKLVALSLLVALAAPAVGAHGSPVPLPAQQCGPQKEHHYATASSLVAASQVASLTWRTTVALFDSCPFDGEGDFGVGGGFLPASHHGSKVCVFDDTGAPVAFTIAAVDPSGVVVRESFMWTTCGSADDVFGPIPPGADGGWWVFLHNGVYSAGSSIAVSAPTTGHIYGF